MAKDNYNIDDILSEVKKRREENEREIKGESIPSAEEVADEDILDNDKPEYVEDGYVLDDTMLQPPDDMDELEVEDEVTQEVEDEVSEDTVDEIDTTIPEQTDEDILQTAEEAKQASTADMVDLFSIEAEDEYQENEEPVVEDKPKKKAKKERSKGRKIARAIIIILLVLILAIGTAGGIFVYKTLNTVTDKNNTTPTEWEGMDKLVEVFNPIEETDASQLASLQDMIKTWYYNGSPVSSTHVLNILLVGEDTRGDDILDSGTRADSAMICSINIDTKKIQLTSVLRDTYAYWENEPGNKDSGTFDKINAAMSLGNINVYKNAVENLYKVKIDNYVIVNFDSFEAIIDAMGGITLELTSSEIWEINNHPRRYGNVYIEQTFDGHSGEVKLTGKQALAYCRIRKLDSDNMRANRQKTCLQEIAKEANDVTPATLIKMAEKLIPYVKTDMSKSTILKLGRYALKQGWLDYESDTTNLPEYRLEERGAGGNFAFAGAWIWKSDFPHDAYYLQSIIYGKSSITLARTRVDYINCTERGYFSEGAAAVWATIPNDSYGVATTFTTTTKESDETTVA